LPPDADPLTREAYSHEVISCGFWPGDRKFPRPAFYSYTKLAPAGLDTAPASRDYWNKQLEEFILPYDDARTAPSPDQPLLAFSPQVLGQTGQGMFTASRSKILPI